jgi:hypothetical protein
MHEIKQRKVTQRHGESPADCCRRMGWTVGTHIKGDEGYGPSTIVITAIGERSILARRIGDKPRYEGCWTLDCRDWHEVKVATTTQPTAPVSDVAASEEGSA